MGIVAAIAGVGVAREYLRSDTVKRRPGLDLSDLASIRMEREPHATWVAAMFLACAALGVVMAIVGLVRALT